MIIDDQTYDTQVLLTFAQFARDTAYLNNILATVVQYLDSTIQYI